MQTCCRRGRTGRERRLNRRRTLPVRSQPGQYEQLLWPRQARSAIAANTVTMIAGTPPNSTTASTRRPPSRRRKRSRPGRGSGRRSSGLRIVPSDELEIGHRRVFFEQLRVNERGQHDFDAFRRRRLKNDFHRGQRTDRSGWSNAGCAGFHDCFRRTCSLARTSELATSAAPAAPVPAGAWPRTRSPARRPADKPFGDQAHCGRSPCSRQEAATERRGAHAPTARCDSNRRSRFRRRGRGSAPRGYRSGG